MAIASTPRSKSSQRAKKARVAARTRVRSIDAGEDIDGCDCDHGGHHTRRRLAAASARSRRHRRPARARAPLPEDLHKSAGRRHATKEQQRKTGKHEARAGLDPGVTPFGANAGD